MEESTLKVSEYLENNNQNIVSIHSEIYALAFNYYCDTNAAPNSFSIEKYYNNRILTEMDKAALVFYDPNTIRFIFAQTETIVLAFLDSVLTDPLWSHDDIDIYFGYIKLHNHRIDRKINRIKLLTS